MKVSLNTIRSINQHYDSAGDPAPNGVDDIVTKIGAQLGAVEEIIDFGKRFEGVVVAKIVSCDDHPNADRLHICKVDDGGKVEHVERDENGHVQVVCGAPNARAGITVAWLPPGSAVPSTFDEEEPFVLEARPLRGEVSNGMLASPKELSIGDNHDGILEIEDDIKPGTYFADAFNLRGDVVIDMENKMFTHRPDCFGFLGIARELEGIQRRPYKSPEWFRLSAEVPKKEAEELKLEIRNEIPELVPRFTAVVLRDVDIHDSPLPIQIQLAKVGLRPINNIVDYTNFFMLETGQPLHAYDYDKVMAQDTGSDHATIVVRKPREGEKIMLLNGKEIEPRSEAIMIATNDKLIGVGGVMGGADTEVDENTKNIIIEVANFDMYSIRRTSMAHGLFTDAVTRFNKGQSPLQTKAVLAKIVDEIRQNADGKVASDLIDDAHLSSEVSERGSLYAPVEISRQFINTRLGFDLSSEEMAQLLRNVEFDVLVNGDNLIVKAPFWRTDIEIPEDVVEEIGRLYGFDHLPLELPKRSLMPAPKDPIMEVKFQIRELLAEAGANEILSYSFVHGNLLDKVGQTKEDAFQLSNALSPDLQYYRMSLTPSLLEKVHPNIKAGFDEFVLFEVNKTHNKIHNRPGELPQEYEMLGVVAAADDKKSQEKQGAAYYEARKYLDYLAKSFGIELDYLPLQEPLKYPVGEPFDYRRSAVACLRGTQEVVGIIGEYRSSVIKALKLPKYVAGFEVDPRALLAAKRSTHSYRALPRFPKVEQDICLRVPSSVSYHDLEAFAQDNIAANRPDETAYTLLPIDIYQREGDDKKQITFRITIASYVRTMVTEEVNKLLEELASAAAQQFSAERI
ncbi:MAG TPA: phenylalanine--tRNA ligase subunit beta [Candidatus Saccharimonadales bacterium]|nr:phenylalanine--tRNA ligase subunit beta [Candidatus Saccharimonadales bacterium]